MNVEDYYPQGKRWWLRLHEKGGKQHEMPAHHLLEKYLDEYLTAAGSAGGAGADKASPLFRTLGGRGRKQLSEARMARQDARRMIVRRALAAGIITKLGCHTFRATGITVYLLNGGLLEYAQQIATPLLRVGVNVLSPHSANLLSRIKVRRGGYGGSGKIPAGISGKIPMAGDRRWWDN